MSIATRRGRRSSSPGEQESERELAAASRRFEADTDRPTSRGAADTMVAGTAKPRCANRPAGAGRRARLAAVAGSARHKRAACRSSTNLNAAVAGAAHGKRSTAHRGRDRRHRFPVITERPWWSACENGGARPRPINGSNHAADTLSMAPAAEAQRTGEAAALPLGLLPFPCDPVAS